MPRRKSAPSYPSKPHSSGQARIVLDGQTRYLGLFDSPESHVEYRRLITQHLGLATGGITPLDTTSLFGCPTVADVITGFTGWSAAHCRPAQQSRVRVALAPVMRRFSDLPAASFTPKRMEEIREDIEGPMPCGYCRERGKTPKTKNPCPRCAGQGKRLWSRKFIDHALATIKQAWDWAATEDLIAGHGLRSWKLRGAKRRRARVLPVKLAMFEATLPFCRKNIADMLRVQHLAGMRPCEVIGIRRCDLSMDGTVADSCQFRGLWAYDVPDRWNKNAHHDQARVVFFGPLAQAILAGYLDRPAESYLFSPREAVETFLRETGRALRFGRKPGEHYLTASYDRAVRAAIRRANRKGDVQLPHWRPNQLRHLRATEIRSRYSEDHARVVLGHRLPGITGVYAEEDLKKAAQVMRKIG
jgi:integrase